MDTCLKNLILEYIVRVNQVCNIMLQGLDLKTKLDLIYYRKNHLQGVFFVNEKKEFIFHGRGCRFIENNLVIDWDFGFDDIWCGINPWLLENYIKNKNINTLKVYNLKRIEEEFLKALSTGEMIKKFDLFYFSEIMNK